jgi:hypothetical protein
MFRCRARSAWPIAGRPSRLLSYPFLTPLFFWRGLCAFFIRVFFGPFSPFRHRIPGSSHGSASLRVLFFLGARFVGLRRAIDATRPPPGPSPGCPPGSVRAARPSAVLSAPALIPCAWQPGTPWGRSCHFRKRRADRFRRSVRHVVRLLRRRGVDERQHGAADRLGQVGPRGNDSGQVRVAVGKRNGKLTRGSVGSCDAVAGCGMSAPLC